MDSPQIENESKRFAWPALVLPYLLAIWCCLAILQGSPRDIPPLLVIAKTVGIVLLAVAIIHAVLLVLIRSTPARELVLLLAVGSIGLYGHGSGLLTPTIGTTAFQALWLAGIVALATVLYRFHSHAITTALIPVCLFAIAFTMSFQLAGIGLPVVNDLRHTSKLLEEISRNDPLQDLPTEAHEGELPDIYYIIVDAYAREDVLKQTYGFDNQPFTSSLRQRGFFIGDESRSNYQLTEISLASSMNMTHLQDLALERFQTRMPIRGMIKDSTVVRFLKRNGYRTIAFETGKSDTCCDNFDQFVSCGSALNAFQDVLYYTSVLPQVMDGTGRSAMSPARRHGERTLKTLESIPKVVHENSKPSFVFSHLLAPHPPFVFDAEGNNRDLHGFYLLADGSLFTACHDCDVEIYRKAYREQVAFINRKLIEMVDQIQSSDRQSIIIIQADHGPRLGFGARNSNDLAAYDNRLREAFSILNAICMPQDSNSEFYSSMTPVNTFRLIFNEVFGTQLEREADDSHLENNYKFQNVTRETLPLQTETPNTWYQRELNRSRITGSLNKE